MDKQKEIEKMEFIISTTVHDCEQKDCIRNCQFARQKDCKYFRAAKDLQAEGYGNVRAAVKEFAEEEKAFIRACDKIKFVARDKGGNLYIYRGKPIKSVENGLWYGSESTFVNFSTSLSFSAIKWEDTEPTSREEILR